MPQGRVLGDCSVCGRPAVIRDRCRSCYARWLRNRIGGRPCSVEGCNRSIYSNGFCGTHYGRNRRYGTPTPKRKTWEDRFWEKVDKRGPDECWPWRAARDPNTHYGRFQDWLAHRASYVIHFGKIPEGAVIDHLCTNPPCVNPAHLEAVSQRENTKRAWAREIERDHLIHSP